MTFGILGPLNVHDRAGTPVPVRRRKARTLLAALLCLRGREIAATQLVEWLWDAPPASASANLHSYVSELRRALAVAGTSAALHTAGSGYQVNVRAGSVDADRFADLAAAGALALSQGPAALAAHHLGQAASLWRGEPLDGVPLPESARSYLERLVGCRLEVLANLTRARVEIGLNNEVSDGLISCPRRRAAISPDPAAANPHALATAKAAPRRTPRQLPAPPDGFVGSNAEMIALEHAALRAHLVAVVGGPGAGKTALTLAWAEQASDVSYVRLCPAEQHFFRSLSVLPERAFTATEVAATLTVAPKRAEDFLDRLDQAGLVQRSDACRYELAPIAHQYISALAADELPTTSGQGGHPGQRSFHRSRSGGFLPRPLDTGSFRGRLPGSGLNSITELRHEDTLMRTPPEVETDVSMPDSGRTDPAAGQGWKGVGG